MPVLDNKGNKVTGFGELITSTGALHQRATLKAWARPDAWLPRGVEINRTVTPHVVKISALSNGTMQGDTPQIESTKTHFISIMLRAGTHIRRDASIVEHDREREEVPLTKT